MRAHFVLGIIASKGPPYPIDIADFVVDWQAKPIVFSIKYCPFCGTQIKGQTVRTTAKPSPDA